MRNVDISPLHCGLVVVRNLPCTFAITSEHPSHTPPLVPGEHLLQFVVIVLHAAKYIFGQNKIKVILYVFT